MYSKKQPATHQASIQQQFALWNERVLPSLDDYIRSGNSLIDLDFYDLELDFGEPKKIKPFLAGRDIKRYREPKSDKFLIFTKRGLDINAFPAIKNHLLQFKKQLMPKPKDFSGDKWPGRKSGSYKWFEIQDAVDYYGEFEKPKILLAEIAIIGQFTPDSSSFYSDTTSYILGNHESYLLGVLNSRLCSYFFKSISSSIRDGFLRWKRQYVENIPIKKIDFYNPSETTLHAAIIANVDLMLQLNKELDAATLPDRREQLKARIGHTDEKIDQMVYQLYGLTAEEIAIVENFR